MADKKLIAAILGAITVYIQTEQQPTPESPGNNPKPQVSQSQTSQRQG